MISRYIDERVLCNHLAEKVKRVLCKIATWTWSAPTVEKCCVVAEDRLGRMLTSSSSSARLYIFVSSHGRTIFSRTFLVNGFFFPLRRPKLKTGSRKFRSPAAG